VHLAAIFIKKQDQGDEDSKALIARAEQIQTKLRNGADFGQLAKEFSEGPGAEEGGDLGFFNAAQLDPELTKRINGLSDGAVSEPIVRPAGIQIVKLISREKGNVKSLQEAKEAIYTILYRQEVNKRFSAWIKELREKAYTKIIF
jgi:peptidyl-prolyl cis-trans isomerase SurA